MAPLRATVSRLCLYQPDCAAAANHRATAL